MNRKEIKELVESKLAQQLPEWRDEVKLWNDLISHLATIVPAENKKQLFGVFTKLTPEEEEVRAIIGAIIDFAIDQRSDRENNWSFNGKSLQALLNEVLEWHENIHAEKITENYSWKPSKLNKMTKGNISIVELTSSHQLTEEGQVLNHCVGSYSPRVSRDENLSIWSLMRNGKKEATVEVLNNEIIQFLGFQNRVIHEKDLNLFMKEWERENKMRKSSWLR